MAHARSTQRGLTLIESMAAMMVLLVGSLGLLSLNSTTQRMSGDARRMTRATAIAQDLLNQIETWPYGDPRLANSEIGNDADWADGALAFEKSPTPKADKLADHDEGDLGTFAGIPSADIEAGYQRFWNVAEPDDSNANGIADGKRVAVIVRWSLPSGGWRRIVLHGYRNDPGEAR